MAQRIRFTPRPGLYDMLADYAELHQLPLSRAVEQLLYATMQEQQRQEAADTTPSTAETSHAARQATPRRQPAQRRGHAQRLADSLIEQDLTPYYDHKALEWWNAPAEECGFHIGEKRQAIHGGHFTDPDMHAAALRLLARLDRE